MRRLLRLSAISVGVIGGILTLRSRRGSMSTFLAGSSCGGQNGAWRNKHCSSWRGLRRRTSAVGDPASIRGRNASARLTISEDRLTRVSNASRVQPPTLPVAAFPGTERHRAFGAVSACAEATPGPRPDSATTRRQPCPHGRSLTRAAHLVARRGRRHGIPGTAPAPRASCPSPPGVPACRRGSAIAACFSALLRRTDRSKFREPTIRQISCFPRSARPTEGRTKTNQDSCLVVTEV